jgi:hypothetical protein
MVFGFLLAILLSCSSLQGKESRAKTLTFAMSLRGLSSEQVVQQMGSEPAEQSSKDVWYYFLNPESEYHPKPTLKRYRLSFSKGLLISVAPDESVK